MNKLTPAQQRRRAQMLRAHYDDQTDTHDHRSPKEWSQQAFSLLAKTTLFQLALRLALAAGLVLIGLKLANKL